jgi:hypothetical protein
MGGWKATMLVSFSLIQGIAFPKTPWQEITFLALSMMPHPVSTGLFAEI